MIGLMLDLPHRQTLTILVRATYMPHRILQIFYTACAEILKFMKGYCIIYFEHRHEVTSIFNLCMEIRDEGEYLL